MFNGDVEMIGIGLGAAILKVVLDVTGKAPLTVIGKGLFVGMVNAPDTGSGLVFETLFGTPFMSKRRVGLRFPSFRASSAFSVALMLMPMVNPIKSTFIEFLVMFPPRFGQLLLQSYDRRL